ncbi:MAG: hypothetical protein QOD13_1374 [Thermoleophilaceae bacterium]|jgi:hypothetical protein|nr:hypothetical protein [Thermoleophilaceae bacterium]
MQDQAGVMRQGLILSVMGAAVVFSMAGCDNGEGVKTVTVNREVTVEKAPPPRKHHGRRRKAPASAAFVPCDPNIQAKAATTTCPFAENVFWTYWTSGESSGQLQVWSPAAHAAFSTTCHGDGAQVTCTTTDNAVVTFAQAAIDRYSQDQADGYASGHDLGPDPYEGQPGAGQPDETDDCQGYDPCITPGPDVDCAGGSGNGPRYVDGPVSVDGSDPYGLDSNYDGVGCET